MDGRTDYACAEACCVDMKSPGNLRKCRYAQNSSPVRLIASSDAMTNRETTPPAGVRVNSEGKWPRLGGDSENIHKIVFFRIQDNTPFPILK